MTARVFIDACVLYPPLVRALVLDAAAEGLFAPLWSARVLDEWAVASLAKGAETEARIAEARGAMGAAFPGAEVSPGAEVATPLPDPADAHVLAAAVAGDAETLLTFNLRDFPVRRLAAHGLVPRHPDGFLWELLGGAGGETMERVIRRHVAATDPRAARNALKRARLARLGKAVEARAGD